MLLSFPNILNLRHFGRIYSYYLCLYYKWWSSGFLRSVMYASVSEEYTAAIFSSSHLYSHGHENLNPCMFLYYDFALHCNAGTRTHAVCTDMRSPRTTSALSWSITVLLIFSPKKNVTTRRIKRYVANSNLSLLLFSFGISLYMNTHKEIRPL